MKKFTHLICACFLGMALTLSAGCGSSSTASVKETTVADAVETEDSSETATASEETAACELADGTYQATFNTDNSMFHVNEMLDGKGTLTVENGQMTLHVSLVSKNIVNLYLGTAEEAQEEGRESEWLQPTTDTIDYDDGTSDEVYGFDIPVPALDTEFNCALIGTKGKWYDHVVSVTDPEPID